jgi:hypothetical protein
MVLSILHVDHDLLHSMKHLILHHQNLLQGWWWVGSVVPSALLFVALFSALEMQFLLLVI